MDFMDASFTFMSRIDEIEMNIKDSISEIIWVFFICFLLEFLLGKLYHIYKKV